MVTRRCNYEKIRMLDDVSGLSWLVDTHRFVFLHVFLLYFLVLFVGSHTYTHTKIRDVSGDGMFVSLESKGVFPFDVKRY